MRSSGNNIVSKREIGDENVPKYLATVSVLYKANVNQLKTKNVRFRMYFGS